MPEEPVGAQATLNMGFKQFMQSKLFITVSSKFRQGTVPLKTDHFSGKKERLSNKIKVETETPIANSGLLACPTDSLGRHCAFLA